MDCFFGGVEALNSELRREESVASGRVGNRDSVGARGGAATTTEDGMVVIPPTPEGAVGSSSAAVAEARSAGELSGYNARQTRTKHPPRAPNN